MSASMSGAPLRPLRDVATQPRHTVRLAHVPSPPAPSAGATETALARHVHSSPRLGWRAQLEPVSPQRAPLPPLGAVADAYVATAVRGDSEPTTTRATVRTLAVPLSVHQQRQLAPRQQLVRAVDALRDLQPGATPRLPDLGHAPGTATLGLGRESGDPKRRLRALYSEFLAVAMRGGAPPDAFAEAQAGIESARVVAQKCALLAPLDAHANKPPRR